MDDMDRVREFLKYIREPLSTELINKMYKENEIVYERCNLYGDYVETITTLIFNTYLGDDITEGIDKEKHFEWCFNKTIKNFKKENIIFSETDELKSYFWEFFNEAFYKELNKDEKIGLKAKINTFWMEVFDYRKIKTLSDMDNLLEVYELLDKTLKNKKKRQKKL